MVNDGQNRTVAFIPVRGGSKSIPFKNIKHIHGQPLVYWVMNAAIKCPYIDHIYVSTDCAEIKKYVLEFQQNLDNSLKSKLSCINRSAETATDTASTESAMIEFANKQLFKHIVLLQATSPLITSEDLSLALNKYKTEGYDSLLSVVRQKRFIWEEHNKNIQPLNYDPLSRPRRQDFNGYLVENGAVYITTREDLLRTKSRLSGKIGFYEMSEETYYELDEKSDWVVVEALLKQRNKHTVDDLMEKLSKVKLFAMDCDGVLTDAGMYYSESGDELKKFNTKDGMGIRLLHEFGIRTAIITGEDTNLVRRRSQKLKIEDIFLGVKEKVSVMKKLIEKYQLSFDEVAYIGDDINDLSLLQMVGVSFSVADAIKVVKTQADFVTHSKGGQGAVREVAELILKAKKDFNKGS